MSCGRSGIFILMIMVLCRDESRIAIARHDISSTAATGQVKFRISGRRASNAVAELRHALSNWNDYYAEWNPEFGWWLREPFATTDSLLEKYQRFLREEVAQEVETSRSGMFGSIVAIAFLIR
jgi:hypothetical protein